jgi:hypothetical protein
VGSSDEVIHRGDGSDERLIVRLDVGGPVELIGLTDSFAALARFYERHYSPQGHGCSEAVYHAAGDREHHR